VAAVREWDTKLAAEHGSQVIWLVCTHGDIIKAVLADALGMHLDSFQRIVVNPCSLSAVSYTQTRPFVQRVNDVGDDLRSLLPAKRRRRRPPSSDATPGGSTGTS
jgi:broad specificity phosphatase PhoE